MIFTIISISIPPLNFILTFQSKEQIIFIYASFSIAIIFVISIFTFIFFILFPPLSCICCIYLHMLPSFLWCLYFFILAQHILDFILDSILSHSYFYLIFSSVQTVGLAFNSEIERLWNIFYGIISHQSIKYLLLWYFIESIMAFWWSFWISQLFIFSKFSLLFYKVKLLLS